MIDQGFWIVLPYDMVRHHPNLTLSPMGVVPQRDRRDRPIVDYSFSQVNATTLPIAPAEAMQFGRAFERLIYRIYHANRRFGPVYAIKVDLSDGFYRIRVTDSHIFRLGVAFPNLPHEPLLVALPLVLPMGWVASPPHFCALTETIADVANTRFTRAPAARSVYLPPHRLSVLADHPSDPVSYPLPPAPSCPSGLPLSTPTLTWTQKPPSLPPHSSGPHTPLTYVDVYMDDFIALAQGHPGRRQHVRSTLFHTIDQFLRPLHPSYNQHRKEPISLKKLHKGDCKWATRKLLLGWIVDTVRETIALPLHRIERLHAILQHLLGRRRISLKMWQQQLGELRSMVLALPGGKGMFSTLYTGLIQAPHRLRITPPLRDALHDLSLLAHDLSSRPTRFGEIVDTFPAAYGAADASGAGMGGVWLSHDETHQPLIWRSAFPLHIQRCLVSWDNPSGSISNSDLELCAQLASQAILLSHRDCRERTMALFTDNIATRSWLRKGSRTTLGPSAYLLRLQAFQQRHYRYRTTADYIPGLVNTMADDASRLWHLSNSELLHHFNSSYPQPLPWTFSPLRPELLSALISALQCKRLDPASFLPEPSHAMLPGLSGFVSAPTLPSTLLSSTTPTLSAPYKSSPTDTAPGPFPPAVNLSDLVRWKTHSAPLPRRYAAWGPLTRGSTNTTTSITSSCNN
jgi:hypothetical protein